MTWFAVLSAPHPPTTATKTAAIAMPRTAKPSSLKGHLLICQHPKSQLANKRFGMKRVSPVSKQNWGTCESGCQDYSNKGAVNDANEEDVWEQHALANRFVSLKTFRPPIAILQHPPFGFSIELSKSFWVYLWPALAWLKLLLGMAVYCNG